MEIMKPKDFESVTNVNLLLNTAFLVDVLSIVTYSPYFYGNGVLEQLIAYQRDVTRTL